VTPKVWADLISLLVSRYIRGEWPSPGEGGSRQDGGLGAGPGARGEAAVAEAEDPFVPGRLYDVYVAATDVELFTAGTPSRVTVSENTYLPASFIAR
jgi:hypothetical protein